MSARTIREGMIELHRTATPLLVSGTAHSAEILGDRLGIAVLTRVSRDISKASAIPLRELKRKWQLVPFD